MSLGAGCLAQLMVGVAAHAASAPSVDLSVASIEVTQGIQDSSGSLPFVGRNSTLVRVRVAVAGAEPEGGVPGVDAMLRIYANGEEIRTSPVFSTNGPIVAPITPLAGVMDHTINFLCLPPEADDVDFVVTVNWRRAVPESDYANNTLVLSDRVFGCRKTVDIAYVPIDYTLGGGLPDPAMLVPGIGDNFLRGAFRVGEWNYHRSPLPPLTWTTNVNTFAPFLLNTLNDIRQNQIPAAGYERPEFIYGWLKGSPFNANGQANGNTDPAKFQRTFAHELGHCWGQPHNTSTVGMYGIDVEAHLADPLGIAPLMGPDKKDVMYPGMLTVDAWVNTTTYLDVLEDLRSQCWGLDGGDGAAGGGGGASDAADPRGLPQQVLRVAGAHDHVMRRAQLEPCAIHDHVVPTADDPRGNVAVESYAADGRLLASVRIDTRACRESCAEAGHLHRATALYANLPRFVDGIEADRIVVRECAADRPSRPLAELERSPHAPRATAPLIEWLAPESIGAEGASPRVRASWTAQDPDGDPLVADLLYTPDGARWIPVAVSQPTAPAGGSFEFDAASLPSSRGASARFRIRVRDGMNQGEAETPQGLSFGTGNPPDVHLLTPNAGTTVPFGATVLLHGSAWDLEDQLLPEALVTWSSSRDGALGIGRTLALRDLSVGEHVITLRGTDLDGLYTERVVTLVVAPRVVLTPDITGDGRVNAADVSLLLSAWGYPGPTDIDMNGDTGASDLSLILGDWTIVEE
ncbi:MAG: hypothetical protein ACKOYN_03730 [Planctomycetota bacterium]